MATAAGVALSSCLLTACFTGVEGTKTITMSRHDVKQTAPTEEEKYLAEIAPEPLSRWKPGRRFFVADDRLGVLLIQRSLPGDESLHPHRGDTLTFIGTQTESHPNGKTTVALQLQGDRHRYLYDTGKTPAEAPTDFDSFDMEALIDLDAIDALSGKMTGQRYWTRTSLWYDADDEDFKGRKYVAVTVDSIRPGNMVFPVKVSFSDADGAKGNYYMNLEGGGSSSSRRFSNLFYLNDLKKRYPSITPEVWQLICDGKVALGMTKQECRLSFGAPLESDSGRSYTSTLDLWQYDGGRYLKFEDGVLVDFRQ